MELETENREVARQSLGEFGKQLAMRPLGRQVQEKLDARLRGLSAGGVLVVDFEGVEMMDYSFADEALGTILSRMAAKEYPDRHLVIETKGDELGDALCWKTSKSHSIAAKLPLWFCRKPRMKTC